ncbi:autotransporter domain-containing protein, partial [Fusobacterium perfoetens]|nr:autotransporter domain-containing protein [Fusobacterium perfoetens]
TKDVTDTYMSVVDDFGRKAGKGEWIAYGKYVNSDTEFDGGKASKGYDGDITGTVGMLEYGVNDTTSYGVVYGQGDTEVDIQGGGKLDGDNTYFGGYVKHRTQGGFDLTGNVGYTKSELDLNLATS